MRFRLALLFLVVVNLAAGQQTGSAAFSELYRRLDSASAGGRFDEVLSMAAPDATIQVGSSIRKLEESLGQAKKMFPMITGAKQSTTITSLRLVGSEAFVSRKTEGTVTLGGQTRASVDIAEDTKVGCSRRLELRGRMKTACPRMKVQRGRSLSNCG
jgi:hypothetical protein